MLVRNTLCFESFYAHPLRQIPAPQVRELPKSYLVNELNCKWTGFFLGRMCEYFHLCEVFHLPSQDKTDKFLSVTSQQSCLTSSLPPPYLLLGCCKRFIVCLLASVLMSLGMASSQEKRSGGCPATGGGTPLPGGHGEAGEGSQTQQGAEKGGVPAQKAQSYRKGWQCERRGQARTDRPHARRRAGQQTCRLLARGEGGGYTI